MFIEYLKKTAKDKIQFRLRTANFFLGKASRLRILNGIHARARTLCKKQTDPSRMSEIVTDGRHGICRLTLLLGPPGCGKTSLLLALSGRLDQSLEVSI